VTDLAANAASGDDSDQVFEFSVPKDQIRHKENHDEENEGSRIR
jgi:hypothetical protein